MKRTLISKACMVPNIRKTQTILKTVMYLITYLIKKAWMQEGVILCH